MKNYTQENQIKRRQMVNQQVRTWDVLEPSILETFRNIPRETYVPKIFTDCAYADVEIPLKHNQCMLRPSILGKILQAVEPKKNEKTLEIGTGSGYLTHCLTNQVSHVISIDIYQDFIVQAKKNLLMNKVKDFDLFCMDANQELPDDTFDIIIVNCSMKSDYSHLVNKLNFGGRLFIFLGTSPNVKATLIIRNKNSIDSKILFETDIPPIITSTDRQKFNF